MRIYVVLIVSVFLYSCVQETYPQNIMFEVDARGLEFDSLSVRGDFPPLDWDTNIRLEDPDGDSIFTKEIILQSPYTFFQFKCVMDETFELFDQPNRRVDFEEDMSTEVRIRYNKK